MTQICYIKVDTKKHRQEVLTTTNVIQDTIEKNNIIFSEKWEVIHDHIDLHSEETCLLKNWVVDLEALSGLQQTAPPILPKYYSWTGGDRCKIDHVSYQVGEVSLLLLRLFVVTGSALHAWRGRRNDRGDGGRGRGGGP